MSPFAPAKVFADKKHNDRWHSLIPDISVTAQVATSSSAKLACIAATATATCRGHDKIMLAFSRYGDLEAGILRFLQRFIFELVFAALLFSCFGSQQNAVVAAQETNAESQSLQSNETRQESAGYGGFKGTIRVTGDLPEPKRIEIPEEKADGIQEGSELFDRSLLLNEKGMLQGAFVFAYRKQKGLVPHPESKDPPKEPFEFKIINCTFVPNCFVLRAGQTLRLVNLDPVGHNPNIQSFNNSSGINLPPKSSLNIVYRNADTIPATFTNDIYPWMQAYVLIRNDPFATTTDKEGSFAIEQIPVGKWKFQFWHSRCGYMKELERDGNRFLGRRGEFTIEIKDGEMVDLGELLIDASSLKEQN